MKSLSPRGRWILGKIKSDNEPDVLFSETVKRFPSSRVFGVDTNRGKVKKLGRPNTRAGDGKNLPYARNSFDCVVLAEVLEHHIEVYKFLTEAYRVLKTGGILVLTTPNPHSLFRWLKHYLLAYEVESDRNLGDYFGYREHTNFIEPLSLIRFLKKAGFKKVDFTTTNVSFPYLRLDKYEPIFKFWPLNRIGTYSCICAIK
jgi:ubiquinone/menaquinone biosynthesis C-methylase UbiE